MYKKFEQNKYFNIVKKAINSLKPKLISAGLLMAIIFLAVQNVYSAVGIRQTINFQGKLVNSSGLNVADSTYSVVFSLYTASSGGSNIWQETQSVPTIDGLFRVELGSSTSLSGVDFNQDELYLGIKVGADAEMTPRVRFTATPYAFQAKNVSWSGLQNPTANTSLNMGAYTNSLIFSGTSASSDLFVLSSSANTTGTGRLMSLRTATDSEISPFHVSAKGVEALLVASSGMVGIGTTNPAQKLEVVGNILASGIISGTSFRGGLGSISAPTFSFTSDPNTGIFSRTDILGLVTSGTEQMTILSNGNVGIGTTAPIRQFSVGSDANDIFTELYTSGTSVSILASESNAWKDTDLAFYTTKTTGGNNFGERMRITSQGNVGIGTTTTDFRLEVNKGNLDDVLKLVSSRNTGGASMVSLNHNRGTTNVQNGDQVSLFDTYTDSNTTANAIRTYVRHVTVDRTNGTQKSGLSFWTQNSSSTVAEVMRISGGNVGIGTTNPAGKLGIGATTGVASPGSIALSIRDGSSPTYGFDFNLEGVSTGDMSIMRTILGVQSQVMTFQRATGNVGIGTTNPGAKLEVNGGTAMTGGWNRNTMLSATYPVLVFNSANSRYGGIGFDNTQGNGSMFFWAGATSTDITASGTQSMVIKGDGNVGIGTANPSFNLSFNNDATKTIGINTSAASTVGRQLTIKAGNVLSGSNLAGGLLDLEAGVGSGTGPSNITFSTGQSTATATAVQTLTERMIITNEGRVGIGTTNPSVALQVAGAITSSGIISGTGSGLTNLNASNISSGTIPAASVLNISGNAATATSLSGFNNPTTSATANTIVYRDSSGHIYGQYILGSYFNASAGNSENPPIGQIWTQNTSDNYLRKSTPAHFISQLGLLTTGNYNSYALPLSGGTMSGVLGTVGIQPVGVGGDSNVGGGYYQFGYQEDGGWTWPYPDLIIGYHTGIKFGANTSYGGMRFYADHPVSGAGELFSIGNGDNHVRVANNLYIGGNLAIHSGNYNSYAPTLTGTGASGSWGINVTGNAATATTFSTGRTNYKGVTDNSVAGQLMWKNYGNNHTIFDASNSTSPNGTAVNNTNAAVAWTATYPTLMGWNGSSTYGVRVDSARVADNADSAGGLAVHAGRNNEANKLVRTDVNGYLQAGWINTPSGGMGDWGSGLTKFYASNDDYVRFVTRNEAKVQLGLTGKWDNDRRDNTTDSNYFTGAMGWGNTDMNSVFDWGSGFFDTWGSPGNSPGDTSHYTGIQVAHYTNVSSRYGWQLAGGPTSRLWFRNTWPSFGGWQRMMTDANDPYAFNMNQYVRTTDSPTFANLTISAGGALYGNHGSWTGEANKIQWHSNNLYFQNTGGGSFVFRRADGTNIVNIDNSGNLSAAYIFGSYFHASAGNSENPPIGQIWTQNTSDNYLRKSTPAHFISQLGLLTTGNYNSYALPLSGGTITGNVGIGNASPGHKLFVQSANAAWLSRFQNTDIGGSDVFISHGGGYGMYIGNGSEASASTYALRVDTAGVIGLQVRGDGVISCARCWDFSENLTGNRDLYVNSAGRLTISSSSIRVKKNVVAIEDEEAKLLLQLRPVSYQYKNDPDGETKNWGFIAEETALVTPWNTYFDDGLPSGLSLEAFVPALVKGFQMNYSNIEKLTTLTFAQQTSISALESSMLNANLSHESLDIIISPTVNSLVEQQMMVYKQNWFDPIFNRITSLEDSVSELLSRVDALVAPQVTASDSARIEDLSQRLSFVEAMFMGEMSQGLNSTISAQLASSITENEIIFEKNIVSENNLTVLAETNLNNVGVTGVISNNLLLINGFDESLATPGASISTVTGALNIQKNSLNEITFMGESFKMDTDGNFIIHKGNLEVAMGSVKGNDGVRGINVAVEEGKGELKVVFKEANDTANYAVGISPSWFTSFMVTGKDKFGFTVKFSSPAPVGGKIDWIVIE